MLENDFKMLYGRKLVPFGSKLLSEWFAIPILSAPLLMSMLTTLLAPPSFAATENAQV